MNRVSKCLGYLALIFLPAIMFTDVYADSEAPELPVEVRLRQNISIYLSKDLVRMDVDPTPSGEFVHEDLKVTVDTNNLTGYELYMNAKNTNNLTRAGSIEFVPTLTSEASASLTNQDNFNVNHWGYGVGVLGNDNMQFKPVQTTEKFDRIRKTESYTEPSETTVTFAARVNHDIEAGTYTSVVSFTAVVDYVPYPTFLGITTMQEMTPSVCATEVTPDATATETTRESNPYDTGKIPEAELTDTRDGEKYIVRKLADGECWMAQNLRLKLTANETLTPADTDISEDFTPTLSTQPTTEKSTAWGGYDSASDVNKTRSHDAGPEYGVLYNWYTATAGQGKYNNTAESTPLDSSLCPKGWRLPIGYTQDVAKSFVRLATTYLGTADNGTSMTDQDTLPQAFNLQVAGYYDYSGSILLKDSDGRFWTASPYSGSVYAYGIKSSYKKIYPQDYFYKIYGFSIRCVAR